ncbi:MAG: SAM hydrolase/SAM-dependent halogenase family protein [Candidatus Rokuibacteriota bacterium]
MIVTLTTDFGRRDAYVAEMKGVVLGIAARAGASVQLVDVTHEVERHDVAEAALALEAAASFFPAGTVHVAVVDPGVGTERRGLVVAAAGQLFVGPDNGIFEGIFEGIFTGILTPHVAVAGWRAWALESSEYRLPVVSRTFHGRDVFAPAAAHLACGVDPARLGPAVSDPVRLPWPEVRAVAGGVAGTVLHVDRFGNLISSVRAESIAPLGAGAVVRVGGRAVARVGTYADLRPGAAGALLGSGGRLEIAVREGSAAAALGARRGTPVIVSRTVSVSGGSRGSSGGPRTRAWSRRRTRARPE